VSVARQPDDADWAPVKPTARMLAIGEQMDADAAERPVIGEFHVGWQVSGRRVTSNDTASVSGLIVDANEELVWVLDDRKSASPIKVLAYTKGAKYPHDVRKAALVAIPVRDIASVQEVSRRSQHSWAKAAWLEAGLRKGDIDEATMALVNAGLMIVRASGGIRG
jgi:hypothetical protein